MIHGNISGVRRSILEEMEALYTMRMEEEFASKELLSALAKYTGLLNREISVYIARDGRVADVSVGDSRTVSMPDMRLVRSESRLSGVRCIHTHPGGGSRLSGVDIGTLKSMRLDCMCALGVMNGRATSASVAYVTGYEGSELTTKTFGPYRALNLPQAMLQELIREYDALLKTAAAPQKNAHERVALIGVEPEGGAEGMLDELAELARTAGAQVVARETQRRSAPDPSSYIGSGKLNELSLLASSMDIDLFVFDDELSAVQIRNLENELGARVIDRTALILDIFASRAASREGRLQVELAQLKYRLPRLSGFGTTLSRLGGGIGTRGPGEKKLEIDRRRIRRRIFELERSIDEVEKQRALRRERRERNRIPVVALVGYTNAGKSTLLNAVSGSDVFVEDLLFATLEPVTRSVTLPGGLGALFSDTVGFIHKLPHDLVKAFRATLEEVLYADLLLHVVDAADKEREKQILVVEKVLRELGAHTKPRVVVYNKLDISAEPAPPDGVAVSAKRGKGVDKLLERVESALLSDHRKLELLLPYSRHEVLHLIRERGRVLRESFEEEGTRVEALLDEPLYNKILHMLGKG